MMLEAVVEDALNGGVDALGGLCLKLNPLWYVGIPDRLCLLPGGRLVFVELKTIGGRVKRKQSRWHERLRALGFRVEVIWTLEQVAGFLKTV